MGDRNECFSEFPRRVHGSSPLLPWPAPGRSLCRPCQRTCMFSELMGNQDGDASIPMSCCCGSRPLSGRKLRWSLQARLLTADKYSKIRDPGPWGVGFEHGLPFIRANRPIVLFLCESVVPRTTTRLPSSARPIMATAQSHLANRRHSSALYVMCVCARSDRTCMYSAQSRLSARC